MLGYNFYSALSCGAMKLPQVRQSKVSLLYEVQADITHSRQRLTHRQFTFYP
jgi:hypothetical protein